MNILLTNWYYRYQHEHCVKDKLGKVVKTHALKMSAHFLQVKCCSIPP